MQKLRTYKLIKQTFGLETYLENLHDINIKKCICSFRISTHRLRIERGRYIGEKSEDRLCGQCNLLENEIHFYASVRNMKLSGKLLYPRHTKYVGVYSFRFSVRPYVRSFVVPSQGQSFCVKVYKTSYFEDPVMDFIHIWHDGRYRSKVFISTIPTPGVTLGSRPRT